MERLNLNVPAEAREALRRLARRAQRREAELARFRTFVIARGDVLALWRRIGFGSRREVERFAVLQSDPFNADRGWPVE
jgi:hypothetical protein